VSPSTCSCHAGLRDQAVDPVAEGIDVLVRIGKVGDSATLISRKLGVSQLIHCAAPSYVRRHGVPTHPRELSAHACVGYLREGRPSPFEFVGAEGTYAVDIQGTCHANDADVLLQLAQAGSGIVALFDFLARDALRTGSLVQVLSAHLSTAWPIHAHYPQSRHLLAKVRVFLDFLVTLFRAPGTKRAEASTRPRAPTSKGRPKRKVSPADRA